MSVRSILVDGPSIGRGRPDEAPDVGEGSAAALATAREPATLGAATSIDPEPHTPAPLLSRGSSSAAPEPAPSVRPASPDVPPALPPAPDYLMGATLDPGPQPIGDIEPQYPETANLQEGTVVIRVLISDAGRVDNVAVVRAEPRGLFEEAALEAFGKARFAPARVSGQAVKSQMTVEVHFLPINRGARISGRGY